MKVNLLNKKKKKEADDRAAAAKKKREEEAKQVADKKFSAENSIKTQKDTKTDALENARHKKEEQWKEQGLMEDKRSELAKKVEEQKKKR